VFLDRKQNKSAYHFKHYAQSKNSIIVYSKNLSYRWCLSQYQFDTYLRVLKFKSLEENLLEQIIE